MLSEPVMFTSVRNREDGQSQICLSWLTHKFKKKRVLLKSPVIPIFNNKKEAEDFCSYWNSLAKWCQKCGKGACEGNYCAHCGERLE